MTNTKLEVSKREAEMRSHRNSDDIIVAMNRVMTGEQRVSQKGEVASEETGATL